MKFQIGEKVRAKGFGKVFEVVSYDEPTKKYSLDSSILRWDEDELEIAEPRLRGFEVVSSFEDKGVILPTRSTVGSAGYDFRVLTDEPVIIKPHETHVFDTGVKAYMQEDEVLMIYVRSSTGIKKGLRLANGTGCIDSDFINGETEGHIKIALTNYANKFVQIKNNDRVAQGIFTKYLTVDNDNVTTNRIGGIGSTGV